MSRGRATTFAGIVIGGSVGAAFALFGNSGSPRPLPEAASRASSNASVVASLGRVHAAASVTPSTSAVSTPSTAVTSTGAVPAPSTSAAVLASAAETQPAPSTSAPVPPKAAVSASAAPTLRPPPQLQTLSTREALLRSEMLCDQKKDFDECTRAALTLEMGTSGAADPTGASRFFKIAITHMVQQCESGSPHACFTLARKYRGGTELPPSDERAQGLEKRGLELCRLRTAPECPAP